MLLDLAKGRHPVSTSVLLLLSDVTNFLQIKQNNLMDVMKKLENIPLNIIISLQMCLDALIRLNQHLNQSVKQLILTCRQDRITMTR